MAFISAERGTSKLSTPGHVYFIQPVDGGPIKIGWATSPTKRLATLQMASPLVLRILYSEPGNGREEGDLHAQFVAHRLHGEWFAPAPEILAEIEARRGRNPNYHLDIAVWYATKSLTGRHKSRNLTVRLT